MFVLMGGGRTSKPFRDSGAPDALGDELQGRFIYWRGRSGQRYLHTVYAVDALPEFADAVVILARRDRRGRRRALSILTLGATPGSVTRAQLLATAAECGASEAHVHLLAGTEDEQRHVLLDLVAVFKGAFLIGSMAEAG